MEVRSFKAIKVFNSNAQPTIAVRALTDYTEAWGLAPAGASTGSKEIRPYRKSIDREIKEFNDKTSRKLRDFEFVGLQSLKNLKLPDGNLRIATEFAILNLAQRRRNDSLWSILNSDAEKMPIPLGNIIGGGAHASSRASHIQEILFFPKGKTFSQSASINAEIHEIAKKELLKKDKDFLGAQSSEGAWVSSLSAIDSLEIARSIADRISSRTGVKIGLGIDLAASQFYSRRLYRWGNISGKAKALTPAKHIQLMNYIVDHFRLGYVEDPVQENDLPGFRKLRRNHGKTTLICGDDLTSTNPRILKKVIKARAINAVIVKPNQIGSLLKTYEFIRLAKRYGLATIMSHRSGSTEDVTIAHLAKAWESDFVKFGVAGGERTCKINELIKIEADEY